FGPADTARLVAWNDTKPALTLQPARWDRETLIRRLGDAGIGAADAPFGAGIRLNTVPGPRAPVPAHLPGFSEGAWIVQDPAHALVCRFAAIPAGALVYDACAAPGGKAVTLEASGARVVAADRRDRLPRLAETGRRAGVAIRCVAADLEAAPFRPGRLDAVLVDAPCSATGTMARHPDARWRLAPDLFPRAAARQLRLLAAAPAAGCSPASARSWAATSRRTCCSSPRPFCRAISSCRGCSASHSARPRHRSRRSSSRPRTAAPSRTPRRRRGP